MAVANSDLATSYIETLPNRLHARIQICALWNDFSVSSIAHHTNCSRKTVSRWIDRFQGGNGLHDACRCGRARRLTDDVKIKAISFYCQVSPLPGCSSWSLRWAEKHLKDHPQLLGDTISHSSLQRILKSHPLRPHLHKYFLQITDPDFFPKAHRIIQLYLNPPENYFCLDECPGIQALRRLNPHLDADEKNRPNYEGFDYERKGTIDLISILAPKDGHIFGRCTPNHNTKTFCTIFREHVETQPRNSQLFYVMDNLSPHFHNDFCSLVAELSGVTHTPKKTAKERREWLQLEDKRIVVLFTPFHGSWLNMVEIWFGILKQKCLKYTSFNSIPELKETIEAFIRTWNQFFAHPFTWKYDGLDLYAKAVRRFNKILFVESPHMDSKFLADELFLMSNIMRDYAHQVPKQDWAQLRELFIARRDYILNIIHSESGPRRQDRVLLAHKHFQEVMKAGCN